MSLLTSPAMAPSTGSTALDASSRYGVIIATVIPDPRALSPLVGHELSSEMSVLVET
jgi:hypothetical protein